MVRPPPSLPAAPYGKVGEMMPRGSNPNSRENLKKGKPFCEESARKAAKKKHENEIIIKKLCDDLRERCTPERIAKMNESIISRAEDGDLVAYKLIRDGLGEDPAKKVELSGTDGKPLEFVWVGEQ